MQVTLKLQTGKQDLPAGATFGKYTWNVTGQEGRDATDASDQVYNLADGGYTATAQAFDTDGNPLGSAVSQPFTVASAPPAQFDAPQGITVVVGV